MSEEQWLVAEERLRRWKLRADRNRTIQYENSRRAKKLHYLIGVPTIAVTALVSTLGFTGLGFSGSTSFAISLSVGVLAAIATISGALQTFLDFGSSSSIYERSGARYGRVARSIEAVLATPRSDRGSVREVVSRFEEMLSSAANDAPIASGTVLKALQSELEDDVSASLGASSDSRLDLLSKATIRRYDPDSISARPLE